MAKINKSVIKEFQAYCWSCYAPGQVHGDIFQNDLTREDMDAACLLQSKGKSFEGDSFDREKARDLILKARGNKTEHFG